MSSYRFVPHSVEYPKHVNDQEPRSRERTMLCEQPSDTTLRNEGPSQNDRHGVRLIGLKSFSCLYCWIWGWKLPYSWANFWMCVQLLYSPVYNPILISKLCWSRAENSSKDLNTPSPHFKCYYLDGDNRVHFFSSLADDVSVVSPNSESEKIAATFLRESWIKLPLAALVEL